VLAAPVLAGCRETAKQEPPIPGATALDAAVADENRLIAAYDESFATFPALVGAFEHVRSQHAAHRDALVAAGAKSDPAASPTPSAAAADVRAARRSLAAAERSAAAARRDACVQAPRALAPLFGSLAASEAAHAVALSPAARA
jgi:hypothetical protein